MLRETIETRRFISIDGIVPRDLSIFRVVVVFFDRSELDAGDLSFDGSLGVNGFIPTIDELASPIEKCRLEDDRIGNVDSGKTVLNESVVLFHTLSSPDLVI